MQNARLDGAQARIKIARRNINNLRYADDTTLMAESTKELSLLLKVKEESEKAGLKLNNQNFPGSPVVENLPANAGDIGSIPCLERSHMPDGNEAQAP